MTPLSNAVETVKMRFSALEVMAMTALSNITNSALNAGKNIVSALTIDPIKIGASKKDETQINAVQTILANTQSKGTTIDQVNAALDELNKYADQTIYNFTEMTRNIGTFTAAGVDLDKSVTSIKGMRIWQRFLVSMLSRQALPCISFHRRLRREKLACKTGTPL